MHNTEIGIIISPMMFIESRKEEIGKEEIEHERLIQHCNKNKDRGYWKQIKLPCKGTKIIVEIGTNSRNWKLNKTTILRKRAIKEKLDQNLCTIKALCDGGAIMVLLKKKN